MSCLFIGNLSKDTVEQDLLDVFDRVGQCQVKYKGNYAFVEYRNEADAEEAMRKLQGKVVRGSEVTVEWAKKTGKGTYQDKKEPKECYHCGRSGHIARACRDNPDAVTDHKSRRSKTRSRERRKSRFDS